MISGGLLSEALKVGMASFIASKSLKIMGKKDFADIIGCVGWLSLGISLIGMWNSLCLKFIEFNTAMSNLNITTLLKGIVDFFTK